MTVALAKVETWEDHVEAWHHAGRIVDGQAWERARIAASLKGRYGEDAVGKFAREVGFSPRAVYYYAGTFQAFPENCNRFQNLTFTHHLHAVALTDSPKEARAALEMADRDGLSANALRAYLKPSASLPPADEFHVLTASSELRDSVAEMVRSLARRWPENHRPHIAELLRSLADELEGEFDAG